MRTGAVRKLPGNGEWDEVGARYLLGDPGDAEVCGKKKNEVCYALYDIASRRIRKIPETAIRNLNVPGAPEICHALRAGITAPEALEYEHGMLAELQGEVPAHVVLRNCDAQRTTLRSGGEPRDLEFRGGLLT